MTTTDNGHATIEAANVALALIAEPLKATLADIEAAMEERMEELAELRQTRERIRKTIARLDPDATKRGKPKRARKSPAPPEAVNDLLLAKGRELREFTPAQLAQAIRPSVPYGHERLTASVRRLHDAGALQFVRSTRGGGKLYKVVGS